MAAQVPKCCGRTMRRDGRQFVCSKCKGWTQTATALVVAVLTVVGAR